MNKTMGNKPWKSSKAENGAMVNVPSAMQVRPSKYLPKLSQGPRNKPHCLNNNLKNEALIKCRSCLFQLVCK